jgi:hypothetical protein
VDGFDDCDQRVTASSHGVCADTKGNKFAVNVVEVVKLLVTILVRM